MRMRHIAICGVAYSIIPQTAQFSKKKIIDHKMCSDFFYNFCLKHFSF
jgi:hypothetical protein